MAASADELAAGRVRIRNRQDVRDLGWLTARWELADDGDVLGSGGLELPTIGPGQEATVDLAEWTVPDSGPKGERWLTVRFVAAQGLSWAPEGFEIAVLQLILEPTARTSVPSALGAPAAGSLEPTQGPRVDDHGLLVHELLASPPRLALWRAPTDNDRIGGVAERWRRWGLDRLERRLVSVERGTDATVARSEYLGADGIVIAHEQRLTRFDEHTIRFDEAVVIPDELTDLARVGTTFEVVPGVESVEWFGTGPHETYPDRKRGGLVGRWRSTVSEQHVPYVRPQENGGHADVRWLRLTGVDGRGLSIVLDRPAQVSVSHYRPVDLATATHDDELRPRAETIVHLDAAHRGLGTASCGPDTLPEYLVGPGTYAWSWSLTDLERS
jgi:beta-galactosidase